MDRFRPRISAHSAMTRPAMVTFVTCVMLATPATLPFVITA